MEYSRFKIHISITVGKLRYSWRDGTDPICHDMKTLLVIGLGLGDKDSLPRSKKTFIESMHCVQTIKL